MEAMVTGRQLLVDWPVLERNFDIARDTWPEIVADGAAGAAATRSAQAARSDLPQHQPRQLFLQYPRAIAMPGNPTSPYYHNVLFGSSPPEGPSAQYLLSASGGGGVSRNAAMAKCAERVFGAACAAHGPCVSALVLNALLRPSEHLAANFARVWPGGGGLLVDTAVGQAGKAEGAAVTGGAAAVAAPPVVGLHLRTYFPKLEGEHYTTRSQDGVGQEALMRRYYTSYFDCAEKMLSAVTAARDNSTAPVPLHIYFSTDQPGLREVAKTRLGGFGVVVHQPSADIRHTRPRSSEKAQLRSTDAGDDNAALDFLALR
jgi:hypothetical protein